MHTKLKYLNQISHIALDIATVPISALEAYEPSVQDDIKRKIDEARVTNPEINYEKFASQDPIFGKIVCLTVGCIVENFDGEQVMRLLSFTGTEDKILELFIRRLGNYRNVFVYNGRRSNVLAFIVARIRRQGKHSLRTNFGKLQGPNGHPHLDLLEYVKEKYSPTCLPFSLIAAVLCGPSPMPEFQENKIGDAFKNEEILLIARYCEWQVAINLNRLRTLVGNYEAIPSENFHSVEVDGECGHLAHAGPDGRCPSVWDERTGLFVSSEVIPAV